MHNQYKDNGMVKAKGSMVTSLETGEMATTQELIISALATSDVVAQLLIANGLVTEEEFLQKLWQGRVTYERLLKPDLR